MQNFAQLLLTTAMDHEKPIIMLHQTMNVRPDDVYDTGVIQPYGVRATSPVARAQHAIDPFIEAIRPVGATPAGVRMVNGHLGIVTADNMPLFGALGQTDTKMTKWYFGAGGLVLGLLAGWGISRMM
jgi:hypothetical protein